MNENAEFLGKVGDPGAAALPVLFPAGRAPVADDGRQFLDDETAHVDGGAFIVERVHTVVADLRNGHRHDLPAIGRVREHFLITGHRGIETRLADLGASGTKGFTDEKPTIFESKNSTHERAEDAQPIEHVKQKVRTFELIHATSEHIVVF